MGSGKSAIGRVLAAKLNWHFIDLDKQIENETGLKIADIFRVEGEAAFRKYEKLVSRKLNIDKSIISTGGGFPVDPENRAWMREQGLIVWLDVSPETIFKRVRHRRHRPLLQNNMNVTFIRSLLESRLEAYQDAQIQIDANSDDLEKKTEKIIEKVLHAQNSN